MADVDPEALLEKIERIPAETRVRVTYESGRSDEPVTRDGVTRSVEGIPLYVSTTELKGNIEIRTWEYHSGKLELAARSTRGPFGNGATLGKLLDVEVIV